MWYNLKEIFRINMKNKVITGLLGFLVVLGMATPALADDVTDADHVYNNGDTTELRGEEVVGSKDTSNREPKATIKVETENAVSHYMVSIPTSAKIEFNKVDTKIGDLQITGNIKDSKQVHVSVTKDAFRNGNSTMDFSVATQVEKDAPLTPLTNFDANSAEAKAGKHTPLFVHIDHAQWDQAVAGKYTGHITFKATLADAQ